MIDRTKEQIIAFSKLKISEITNLKVEEIDEDEEFFSLGLDSVKALFVLQELEEYLDIEINPLVFWNHPTISSAGEFLSEVR
ncbi:MAG: acyl carrier protein [Bacteroidota bacterium]